MRTIHKHEVTQADKNITIRVVDEPGAGGANYLYYIDVPGYNPIPIPFQNGPVEYNIPNGITQEVLLAIVIDRLKCFQAGPFACRENAIALTNIEQALLWLKFRTWDRIERSVEGKSEK